MANIAPSPPFNLSPSDWKSLAFGAAFAVIGALCGFATATAIPTLQSHEANEFGALIVTVLTAFIPWLLSFAKKYLTDTTTVVKLVMVAAFLSACSCGSAVADDVAVVFDGNKPGSYIVTVDGLGGITASPLSKVVRIGPSPTPTPTPDPSPVLTDRAKAIRDVAMKVTSDPDKANTAKGLAVLYREIAKLVRQPGQVKDVPSLVNAVSTATNTFLASRGTGVMEAWQPTRNLFGTQWTVLSDPRRQPPAPLTDYAVLLDDAANGLDASAPAMRGISPELLALIMQIIQIILALLKPV